MAAFGRGGEVPGKRSGDECCVLGYLGHGWTELAVSSSSPRRLRHLSQHAVTAGHAPTASGLPSPVHGHRTIKQTCPRRCPLGHRQRHSGETHCAPLSTFRVTALGPTGRRDIAPRRASLRHSWEDNQGLGATVLGDTLTPSQTHIRTHAFTHKHTHICTHMHPYSGLPGGAS